ncbi:MAG: sugar transferase [Armatimonadota bacterium]|nr:sugar transferase [Armatimonadota bacterium]
MRRALDVAVAAVLLGATAPLLGIIAACNWLAIRRVFFTQTRVGRGLVPFSIVKFQTMIDGAQHGGTVTARGDPRVTPLGRLLRATKLDELPQLLNVLRGEMSLVGPRPLTPNEVAAIPAALASRLYAVAPGMTGIASLAFIDEERVLADAADPQAAYFEAVLPRKVALELAYAGRRTWVTDLVIIILTPVVGFSEGLRRAALRWLVPDAER